MIEFISNQHPDEVEIVLTDTFPTSLDPWVDTPPMAPGIWSFTPLEYPQDANWAFRFWVERWRERTSLDPTFGGGWNTGGNYDGRFGPVNSLCAYWDVVGTNIFNRPAAPFGVQKSGTTYHAHAAHPEKVWFRMEYQISNISNGTPHTWRVFCQRVLPLPT